MAITGNLRTMQLSELLQWLSMGQKTGTLVVKGGSGEKRIVFQGGRIISSSSTLEREYLGHFLVAYSYITDEELTKAMEVQRESKILLGKILVMIGAISEEDLTDLIRLKAAETIYDIFLWTEGAFEFIDGEVPKVPMVPISADVTGIVMEGLRRFDEWQRIRTKVTSVREIPALTAPVDPGSIPERERLILHAIDGQRSIDQIALATHNPDFHVAKFVFELLETGQARVVGERVDEVKAPPSLALEDPYETVFAEAETSPFAAPAVGEAFPTAALERLAAPRERRTAPQERLAPAPHARLAPPPTPPPARDVSRFLKRGPDSSASLSDRSPVPRPPPPPSPTAPARGPAPRSVIPKADEEPVLTPSTALVPRDAVPQLVVPMDELMSWSFTPNEAFIVSRINGLWDIRSIAKISPFPELEVLRVFQKLHAGGVVAWR